MLLDYHTKSLTEALEKLRSSPLIPAAVAHLADHAAAVNDELDETIVAQIAAFSESSNPDVLPKLAEHGSHHTRELVELLGGRRVGDFEFVREYARWHAENRFPLEPILHAYRCSHKVLSRRMREAVLAAASPTGETQQAVADVADLAIEYTDAVSTIAASSYVSQSQLIADVAGDQRTELLNILLDGYDESDGRVAKVLRSGGYLERRQSFCVAVARSVNPSEMLNPARARRMVDSIDRTLRDSPARRLIDLRDNKVTIVFSANRRASGWTVPRTALAERLKPELMMVGNAVLMGVSNDVPSTSQIPNAYRQALLALELADATHRVVQFSEVPVRRLLLHLAGEQLQRVLPAWSRPLYLADDKSGGVLGATLRAYAEADMNVLKAAESMSVHPNTIYARLQKILDLTGLEARSFHGLSELLAVIDCRPFDRGAPSPSAGESG